MKLPTSDLLMLMIMMVRGSVGEIPSFKLFESERVFAFLDIQPLSRGHAVCGNLILFWGVSLGFCLRKEYIGEGEGLRFGV